MKSQKPKKKKNLFEIESEVLPCFEMNYKFLERHKIDKNPVNTAQKMASESSTTQDNVATMEEVLGSIVIYKEEEIAWTLYFVQVCHQRGERCKLFSFSSK